MRRVFAALEQAATGNGALLIEGETGTGKEVVADSVHRESARRGGPFIVIDCGAIPPNLLESELFGHERGAFTGALTARTGAFEAASGGTIFLDEIGELSHDLQPKLLRVLERREIKRVGENKYRPVDVRVIAATNRNLFADVNSKHFRADLYYRLSVLSVRLPALRERADDLPVLVDHLLGVIGASAKDSAPLRTEEFLAELAAHSWPGNVRELRNYLERCVTFKGKVPMASTFAGRDDARATPGSSFQEQRDQHILAFEKRYAQDLLRKSKGNMAAAAREAGMNRVTLYRLLWKLGLK
jgi:DNA-binding NtrC family response regulator